MTFHRKIGYVVALFCLLQMTAFATRNKLFNKPIIIDDIIAVGGFHGIQCGYQPVMKSQYKNSALINMAPGNIYVVKYLINSEAIASFKMTLLENKMVGVDPLKYKFKYESNGEVNLNFDRLEDLHNVNLSATNAGVMITYTGNDNQNYTFEVTTLVYSCKINPNFDIQCQVMPNPVDDVLNLSFYAPIDTKADIFIVNTNNNTLQFNQSNIEVNAYCNNLFFNVNHFNSGNYALTIIIKQADGSVAIQQSLKFIKL
jgi:hypothetical protein